ncbi:TPA: hexose kinase [Escherichia coli]|nr:hexose kinase [Escherichia coli]HDQ1523501.1 hexose kinase [Escherichia coli]
MILTVTMNPSVDISYPLKKLELDTVNRVSDVRKEAGGKGLNVSRVIKLAGEKGIATGLIGGNLGKYITSHLDEVGIEHSFLQIAQESRNCIAILHEELQTEILELGPEVTEQEQEQFIRHFTGLLEQADTVTLSGSLPVGVPKDFYQTLIRIAHSRNKKVLLDCSGECLKRATTGADLPYLIKPNKQELEQLTGQSFDVDSPGTFIKLISSHQELQKIPWVVVSLGKNGAFAKIEDNYFTVRIPEINVINAVGSGDSTIAGLAVGISNHDLPENILKRAMAFGMLNAMEPQTGCINMIHFEHLFNNISVVPCH